MLIAKAYADSDRSILLAAKGAPEILKLAPCRHPCGEKLIQPEEHD
jgi:hypothetical protein